MAKRLQKKINRFHDEAEEIAKKNNLDLSVLPEESKSERHTNPHRPIYDKLNKFKRPLVARPLNLVNGKSPFPYNRTYLGRVRSIRTQKHSSRSLGGRRKTRHNRKQNRKSHRK